MTTSIPHAGFVLAAFLLAGAAGAGERLTCADPAFSVESATTEFSERMCDLVDRALPALEACRLEVSAPVHIVVSDDLGSVPEGCLGYFLCDQSEIRIRTIDGMARAVSGGSMFSTIDKETYFESVVVHEMAHALFEQTACARAKCAENHEYVAHAMQMAWLPEADRERLVTAFPAGDPIDPLRLNAFMAAFAPDRYAATVWQHFSLPGNGCAIVGRLVAGEQSLQLMPE